MNSPVVAQNRFDSRATVLLGVAYWYRTTARVRSAVDTCKTRSCPTHGKRKWRNTGGMNEALPCLRRTEPSEALIPRLGQSKLAYIPAARTDIRKRIHEFNRRRIAALEARLG